MWQKIGLEIVIDARSHGTAEDERKVNSKNKNCDSVENVESKMRVAQSVNQFDFQLTVTS